MSNSLENRSDIILDRSKTVLIDSTYCYIYSHGPMIVWRNHHTRLTQLEKQLYSNQLITVVITSSVLNTSCELFRFMLFAIVKEHYLIDIFNYEYIDNNKAQQLYLTIINSYRTCVIKITHTTFNMFFSINSDRRQKIIFILWRM